MKAYLHNYRQSPRKVRLVTDAVKGKPVVDAINILNFMAKRGAEPISKLLNSAIANAKSAYNLSKEDLMVSDLRVDTARVLKRSMPRARGSAFPIKKRSSHVTLTLMERVKVAPKAKIAKIPQSKK